MKSGVASGFTGSVASVRRAASGVAGDVPARGGCTGSGAAMATSTAGSAFSWARVSAISPGATSATSHSDMSACSAPERCSAVALRERSEEAGASTIGRTSRSAPLRVRRETAPGPSAARALVRWVVEVPSASLNWMRVRDCPARATGVVEEATARGSRVVRGAVPVVGVLLAVVGVGPPVCVVAGAGTGKTRTITRRIAHLIDTGQVNPGQVLAVTFTQRAAGEMRARLRTLDDGTGTGSVQAQTFHAAARRQLAGDRVG